MKPQGIVTDEAMQTMFRRQAKVEKRRKRKLKYLRQAQARGAKGRAIKAAMGIPQRGIMPSFVGRGRWLGMRDYAPELNGPVKVRKVEPRIAASI